MYNTKSEMWSKIMNSLNITCDMIKWLIIFIFVFECLSVKIYITSTSLMELTTKREVLKKRKYIAIIVSSASTIVYRVVIMIMLIDGTFYQSNYEWVSMVGTASRTIYLITFSFIAYLWINLVNELISIKKEKLIKNSLQLTPFN
jgi:hypothetical protein